MNTDGGCTNCNVAFESDVFKVILGRGPPQQGDILFSCPYLYLYIDEPVSYGKTDFKTVAVKHWEQQWHVIILGHSCDLENDKIDLVVLCPIWEIGQYYKNCATRFKIDKQYRHRFKNGKKQLKDDTKSLIREATAGKRLGYHVLKGIIDPIKTSQFEIQTQHWLVDFTNTYALPLDFLNTFCKKDVNNDYRLRLTSDYRLDLIARFNYFLVRAILPTYEFNYKKDVEPFIEGVEAEVDMILQHLQL